MITIFKPNVPCDACGEPHIIEINFKRGEDDKIYEKVIHLCESCQFILRNILNRDNQ
jgi:hypothetical protein